MSKIFLRLIIFILVVVVASAVWMFEARRISLYFDRFGMPEDDIEVIRSITYEGSGTGGVLYANQVSLSLNNTLSPLEPPSVGSTQDGKLGLAAAGKVFSLGQLTNQNDENTNRLTAAPEGGDDARIILGHSFVSWPTPFDFNFMTGSSPSWRRHTYQKLMWNKADGTRLEMLWRYEQYYDKTNGWTSPTMMREGETGLIRIKIEIK